MASCPMIYVTKNIALDEREIEEQFIRASGPGGPASAGPASVVGLLLLLPQAAKARTAANRQAWRMGAPSRKGA